MNNQKLSIIDLNEIFLQSLFSKENFKMIPHLKGDINEIDEIDLNIFKQSIFHSINSSPNKNDVITNKNSPNSKFNINEASNYNNLNNLNSDNEYTSIFQNRDNSIEEIIEEKNNFLPKLYELGSVKYPIEEYENSPKIKFKNDLYLNSKNPYLYSSTELHPFSFFYGNKTFLYEKKNKKKLILPSPRLIEIKDWLKVPNYTKEGIYKGIKIDNKNGLVIIDPNVTKKYSGLITNMIWQILKVPFGHTISLQIKMFEPKCLMERFTNVFSLINYFLIPASNPKISPLERFKLITTFGISGLYIPVQQLKPFNPTLGETFQAELSNGTKLYVEQVSHIPLASRFYIIYKNLYKIHGYFAFSVNTESFGSTVYVVQKGPVNVEFPQLGEIITFTVPKIKLLNASSEKGRSNLYEGIFNCIDCKNELRCIVKFYENKKIFHEIKGEIFYHKYDENYKFDNDKEWDFGKKYKFDNNKNIISKIKGSWLEKIYIDNKIYWDIDAQIPDYFKPCEYVLPSDGRYREDLIWLFRSFYNAKNEKERQLYEDIAQEWKVTMEKFGRLERKMRQNGKK